MYSGHTLVLKVGGTEIESPDFSTFVDDVQALIRSGVRIVIVYGGGEQISRHYGRPRTKVEGMGVTDAEVLQRGVLPASEEIRRKLLIALPEGVVMPPEDIICDLHPNRQLGFVGLPRDIALPEAYLSLIGFVGQAGDQRVNVNADDIARKLVEQYSSEVEELIFLTSAGGVLDREDSIVPLLTAERIPAILSGNDKYITADGGMKKKLEEALKALPLVGKVVMTKIAALRAEIEQWMGSGTLCIDNRQLQISSMQWREEGIFDAVHDEYVKKGIFRPRTAEELRKLKTHHSMLRVKHSPLGGFSLLPQGKWVEIAAMWAGTIGNGIGRMLLDAALAEAHRRKTYALSTHEDAIRTFTTHSGFENLGLLSGAKIERPDDIPEHLATYDTDKRNPYLFIARSPSPTQPPSSRAL